MVVLEKMNKRRSFKYVATGLSLLGMAAGLGALGVGYRKEKHAGESISSKGTIIYVLDHIGKVLYRRPKVESDHAKMETQLMVSSSILINHIGLMIPSKIKKYNVGKPTHTKVAGFNKFEAKTVFADAIPFWERRQVYPDTMDCNRLILNHTDLSAVLKLVGGTAIHPDCQKKAMGTALTFLKAIRSLQLGSYENGDVSLMSLLNNLSQTTANSSNTQLVGGLILSNQLGASFDMKAENETEFEKGVHMSSELDVEKDIALNRILDLFRNLRNIKLPIKVLGAATADEIASIWKGLDVQTMKAEGYVQAIDTAKKYVSRYLHLTTRQEAWRKEHEMLGFGAVDSVTIWFFRASTALKPHLYDLAATRRALFAKYGTLAKKGQEFSLDSHNARAHLSADNLLVDQFCRVHDIY